MGLTYTEGTVGAIHQRGAPVEAKFLVDTGAIDCVLPTASLLKAGVEPEGSAVYELADGASREMVFGWARICFMDTVVIVKVVFGPDGVEPILGVIALESAGVAVDPVSNTLKRLATRSLKSAA